MRCLGRMLVFFICLCLFAVSAAGAGKNPVTPTGDEVTVTGTTSPNGLCLITAVKSGATREEILSGVSEIQYQGEFRADANGAYSFVFPMRPDAVSGEYVVRIRPRGGVLEEYSFTYFSSAEITRALDRINTGDAKEIKTVLRESGALLGLVFGEDAVINREDVYERVIKAVKSGTTFMLDSLVSFYNAAVVLEAVAQSDKAFLLSGGWLSQNSCTKLDTLTLYSEYQTNLSESGVSAVHAALFGKSFADIDALHHAFEQEVLFNLFTRHKLSGYGHIGGVITAHKARLESVFGISFLDYDALQNKDKVHQGLIAAGATSPETLKSAIESLSWSQRYPVSPGNAGAGGQGQRVPPVTLPLTQPPAESKPPPSFSDLDGSEWARESILALAGRNIVNGKEHGRFSPNDLITREEFVKMIVLAFGFEDASADCDFTDVKKTDWFYSYVAAAAAHGLINGYGDNRFGTGRAVTRQDMAAIAYRASLKADKRLPVGGGMFMDADEMSEYAKEAVYAMKNAGIISGVGEGRFDPLGTATRAQTAKVIYYLLNHIGMGGNNGSE